MTRHKPDVVFSSAEHRKRKSAWYCQETRDCFVRLTERHWPFIVLVYKENFDFVLQIKIFAIISKVQYNGSVP